MLLQRPSLSFQQRRRRTALGWGAAALAALALGNVGIGLRQPPVLEYQDALTAQAAEPLSVTLPDQSTLTLSPGSRVRIRYLRERREILLERGQVSVSVAPDADRVFVVLAGCIDVRGTGQYTVRRQDKAVDADVSRGSAEVQATGWAFWRRTELQAGQRVTATADGFSAVSGGL